MPGRLWSRNRSTWGSPVARFEGLIRPFETKDFRPPRRVIPATEENPENVVLVVGSSGSPKTVAGSYNFNLTTYMTKRQKEQRR